MAGAYHALSPGVWAVTYTKDSGGPHMSYDEVIEEALAFGWVDSQGRKLDERRWQLYCAPRKPGSAWSRANRARIERPTAGGLIHTRPSHGRRGQGDRRLDGDRARGGRRVVLATRHAS